MQKIEGRFRVAFAQERRSRKAGQEYQPKHDWKTNPQVLPQEIKHKRYKDIELLLDTQAPGMHQRIFGGLGVEIVDPFHEPDIRGKEQRADGRTAEIAKIPGNQGESADGEGYQDDQVQRRKNPPRTPPVEFPETECSGL